MLDTKIEHLHPIVAGMTRTLLVAAKEAGLVTKILETRRLHIIQVAYHAQGREPLPVVNALRKQAGLWPITEKENEQIRTKTLTSVHEFGLAVDVGIIVNGKLLGDIRVDTDGDLIPDYEELGKIGEKIGFEWGGRFGDDPRTLRVEGWDQVHFQYTGGLTLAQLAAGMRPGTRTGRA